MLWIWLGLIITLTLIELLTTNLVTIWYVLSAFISLILSMFIDNYIIEFSVFVIIGTVLLFTIRDYFIKKINQKRKETIINKIGVVIEDIRIYLAMSDKKIKIGHKVKVIDIEGTKLKVVEDNNEK